MIRNSYGELLKPAKIGTMQLKNRICMAPMDFKYFDGNEDSSSITYRQVKVFEARAKGGCGLIFTCATQTEREIMPYPRLMQFPLIDRDERIKEFAAAADAVHVYGAKIACELTMGSGRYADTMMSSSRSRASALAALTRLMVRISVCVRAGAWCRAGRFLLR